MQQFWPKLRGMLFPHTVYLERELDRTRAELSRWQNALLTEKGLPTITPTTVHPLPHLKAKLLPSQWRTKAESLTRTKEAANAEKASTA